jgi:hypothetical protein
LASSAQAGASSTTSAAGRPADKARATRWTSLRSRRRSRRPSRSTGQCPSTSIRSGRATSRPGR